MKLKIGTLLLMTIITFAGTPFSTAAATIENDGFEYSNGFAQSACIVADPTSTKLNVRSRPNGRVLRKLANGTVVRIEEYGEGEEWVKISLTPKGGKRRVLGWVVQRYLNCN
ncbi:MAG: SH3 domain-containing protein [Pyrinomonadaceae bacterium]|nr:SH3 domain-containing protein [Pyrinomonadaceae bacterium]